MTSDPDEKPAETIESSEEKPKAKARKKKATAPAEEIVSEPAAEAAPAKAPRKATKKAAKKSVGVSAETPVPAESDPQPAAEVMAESVEPPAKPTKKSARKKAVAAEKKGRDLVTEEPGAQEVAEVLHEAATEAEEAAPEDESRAKPKTPEPKPEPKLERLQKILAKTGVASRRAGEEMILGGRVQVNGQVVTTLGTKADLGRDHIRVDGKLLSGPERLRYFVLNKPKGYVTTVSDPEGRPTVIQFFAGERERLYPVGRLDYLSEGLLLVTNDGELANKLTKASSGVEKTYLVKVAGQPTEEGLETLRQGVVIERGRHGSGEGRVRTAPAQIRKVREGDNPWYEVIVIEGRNRELRKMFEEIGHHVEKIRRIGYGPLILDLEPGKMRELEAEELHTLRLAAEGKLKTRRRRGPAPAQLPKYAGKPVRYKQEDGPRTGQATRPIAARREEFRPESRPQRPARDDARFEARPPQRFDRLAASQSRPPAQARFRPEADRPPRRSETVGQDLSGRGNFAGKPRRNEPPVTEYVLPVRQRKPEDDMDDLPPKREGGFGKGPRVARPEKGFGQERRSAAPPSAARDISKGQATGRRMYTEAPSSGNSEERPPRKEFRPRTDRPAQSARPFRPKSDRPYSDRPRQGRPFERSESGSATSRPARTGPPRTGPARSGPPRSGAGRPAGSSFGDRKPPFRPRGEFRPREDFRSQSGERPARFAPRAEGAPPRRPRPFVAESDRPREFRPRSEGSAGPARKFSGGRPAPGGRPASGRPSKSGPGKTGPGGGTGGEPRIKERWRNSFTGKNKGRPKPKPRKDT